MCDAHLLTTDFGGHSDRVTPVPIPNTEVKPVSADGTWGLTPWESRTPPDFSRQGRLLREAPFVVFGPVIAVGLRPHAPSPPGSLALARSAGGCAAVASTFMSSNRSLAPRPRRGGRAERRQATGPAGAPATAAADGGRAPGRRGQRQARDAVRRADPEAERAKIESRTLEQWIDEGDLRSEATQRGDQGGRAPTRRRSASVRWRPTRRRRSPPAPATPGGPPCSPTASARRRRRSTGSASTMPAGIASQLLRELPKVAAVHEVLGLAAYRSGRWKQAATELETAQQLHPTVELLPVLADVYRAQRRWDDVERVWADVRAASPAQEVLAEARIVAAGAQADQGDLRGALRTMRPRRPGPQARVRDHHLRQWYVLADLHDRAGDTLEATRWFELVARHDPDFVDVLDAERQGGRASLRAAACGLGGEARAWRRAARQVTTIVPRIVGWMPQQVVVRAGLGEREREASHRSRCQGSGSCRPRRRCECGKASPFDPLDGRAGGDLERARRRTRSRRSSPSPRRSAATVGRRRRRTRPTRAPPATARATVATPTGIATAGRSSRPGADPGDERQRQGDQPDDLGDEGDRCLRRRVQPGLA